MINHTINCLEILKIKKFKNGYMFYAELQRLMINHF